MMRAMALIALQRPLVLATASPARRQLLADAGIACLYDAVTIDERPHAGEAADTYVERLAREKADAVVPPALDALVVTVDTAVAFDGEIIGKPRDRAHARAILMRLGGRDHAVVTAIALRDVAEQSVRTAVTRTGVRFQPLTDAMLDWYLDTGEWEGRAGGYAIQGKGALLVERVEGCYTNVIGLSMPTLVTMLNSVRSSDGQKKRRSFGGGAGRP